MVMQSLLPTTAPQRVLHTTIAHVSKPTASDAHTYTQFLVRVSDERSPGLHWAVYRRYSEFRNLKLALEDAVAQYQKPPAGSDLVLADIKLSADEAAQLVAFLKALTADRPAPAKPVLP